uniref:Uncharacterized protein n=1 Tax=viral metagenome TaxID=1070528 RepID=A0A6M3IM79_9ZZZZ
MADKPRWAPLKVYLTAEVIASPQVLLERTMDYLQGINPKTGMERVPATERVQLMKVVCEAKNKGEWLGIIRRFVSVVDKDAVKGQGGDGASEGDVTDDGSEE